MAPATNTYSKLGTPKFVADEGSVMLRGTGFQVDWSKVSAGSDGVKRLPAGTLIHLDSTSGLGEVAVETTKPAHGILVSDVDDQLGQNKAMHGLYLGGVFYQNLMPTVPTATQKTELGPRFVFQVYQDTRVS